MPAGAYPRPSPTSDREVLGVPRDGWRVDLPGKVHMVAGGTTAGDYSSPGGGSVRPGVTWVRQVHGSRALVVTRPGEHAGEEADALVTAVPGAVLVVRTADCAPIGLGSTEGVAAVVHAGWRGLVAGVVDEAVRLMRTLGASRVFAALGPCVHAHGYEFSPADLDIVAGRLGEGVRGLAGTGRPALDVPAAAAAALSACHAELVASSPVCTHCSDEHWSWRARGDGGRQGTAVWVGDLPDA